MSEQTAKEAGLERCVRLNEITRSILDIIGKNEDGKMMVTQTLYIRNGHPTVQKYIQKGTPITTEQRLNIFKAYNYEKLYVVVEDKNGSRHDQGQADGGD